MNDILVMLMEDPDLAKEMISELISKYKPLAYSIANELLVVYKDFANNTDYFETVAIAKRNQYDAYISVGFSKEEAMILILNEKNNISESLSKSISNIKINK